MKNLYRIGKGKVLAGVCGGLSQYLNIDVSLVRIITVLAGFAMFPWIPIAYIAAAIIIPEKRDGFQTFDSEDEEFEPVSSKPYVDPRKSQTILGGALVVIGLMFLLKNISHFFAWIDFGTIFAAGLVAAGLYVLFGRRNNV